MWGFDEGHHENAALDGLTGASHNYADDIYLVECHGKVDRLPVQVDEELERLVGSTDLVESSLGTRAFILKDDLRRSPENPQLIMRNHSTPINSAPNTNGLVQVRTQLVAGVAELKRSMTVRFACGTDVRMDTIQYGTANSVYPHQEDRPK